jgi:uncharacterized protein (UPF0332 family)
MDSLFNLYLKRSQNELNLSLIIMRISGDRNMQVSVLKTQEDTYYSAAISHAYYCIFYAAKAYLLTKGIKTEPPHEHKKTLREFKRLVSNGIVDVELLNIYEETVIKADALMHIFDLEKEKRGRFTYKTLPQTNYAPAKESIENAQKFFRHIYNLCKEITDGLH